MTDMMLLRYGDKGPMVELLQLALYRGGYYHELPDGMFGARTLEALKIFQNAWGLLPDGTVGERTWGALHPWLTGYRRHKIKSGDTIYRLSRTYATTLRAIETANPQIDPFGLQIGGELIIPLGFPVVSYQVSMTPMYLELCVEGLTARYPFIEKTEIGKSVIGYPIYALKIGDGENSVFYNGTHHANEWITSTLLMCYLEEYASATAGGGTIFGQSAESLYELTKLHLVPMVNPDGVALVTGMLTDGVHFDKAMEIAGSYPQIPFPDGWKANIEGVDPNLQYPAGWAQAQEIKYAQGYVSPAPRDYVGAAPLEIPESRAVYNYTMENDFSLTISYHTQGKVIYWRYLNFLPDNSWEIAEKFSAVSGYPAETTPAASGYAGYKDWFISFYNRPGYTVEAGEGTSPLPLSQFPEIYADNKGILTLGLSVTA